jgi:hypothetical protein
VKTTRRLSVLLVLFTSGPASLVSAQIVEAVGPRALGMGGAFVAVANDSSATWWNPAGLAAGPFLDMALGRAVTGIEETLPARRDRVSWLTLATPPIGFSYYRLRITDIQPVDSTAQNPGDREDRRAGVPVRSLSASQLGATLVQTLLPGVHAGTTVKYVRGAVLRSQADGLLEPSELLGLGQDLDGGDSEGRFDLDVGVLAVDGPFRLGGVIRNVREPVFDEVRLPRQVRLGAAFDGDGAGLLPLTIAIDADVRSYHSAAGARRVIAIGAEQWFAARRLGVRAGARFNAVGAKDRTATAGISAAVRSGLYVDGHVVRGGAADERGWGVAARVSF